MQQNLVTDCNFINNHTFCMAKIEIDIGFAERFRRCINEKGWAKLTRKQIGKELGISDTCVTFYFNGNRLPAMDHAIRLAGIFNVSVEWFLTGRGNKEINDSNRNMIDVSELSEKDKAAMQSLINSLTQQKNNNNCKKKSNKS
jgi:transcriptional regulator with XRE-family HTH domain